MLQMSNMISCVNTQWLMLPMSPPSGVSKITLSLNNLDILIDIHVVLDSLIFIEYLKQSYTESYNKFCQWTSIIQFKLPIIVHELEANYI